MSHLTLAQRYTIETLLRENYSKTVIALRIGKDKSVVYREVFRNKHGRSGEYIADLAERKKDLRHSEKLKKIHFTEEIKDHVNNLISEDYSPEQIVGFSKLHEIQCVSHERIYQYIWKDKKQGGVLYKHLRTKGRRYRKRGAAKDRRGQIVARIGIEQRPTIVDEKIRFGDIEIDLIIGECHKQALLTINDRLTGMLKIRKVESKEAVNIEQALILALEDWKPYLHTITSDNGKEFANHAKIAANLCIDYYFARPYHSWERGANENLNGLIRQYFPKKTSFVELTEKEIMVVENKLNNRPRKRLGYKTPNSVYLEIIKNQNHKVAFMT